LIPSKEVCPKGHVEQFDEPVSFEYCPCKHGEHPLDPGNVKVPAGHVATQLIPSTDVCPVGHCVQLALAGVDTKPDGHLMGEDEPLGQ
jgi:hypothetical protein